MADQLPNFNEGLNQVFIVPAGAGVGRRGRGAGFYCRHCDFTFKDSIQYLDHARSRTHLERTGKTAGVQRATLVDVRRRIDELASCVERPYNLQEAKRKAREQLALRKK